jgi:hypothetical protein
VPPPPKPDRRRPRAFPGRRLALALIACLGVLALTAGGAVADDSGPIVVATVHPASGQPFQDSVSPAQLFANPGRCPLYTGGPITEYGRTGPETPPENPQRTWLLGTALSCMSTPINPATLPNLNVIVTGSGGAPQSGTDSQLTAADLSNPSDFQNSAWGPIVQSAGINQYDRPPRGASDLDFLDEFQSNGPIAVDVYEGGKLTVNEHASPTNVTVGTTVSFSAVVTGNNGSALSYNWNFGGGGTPNSSSQPSPQIQFNSAGVWPVSVDVSDDNGAGGGDQLTVTVTQPGSTTTPTTTGVTTTGPDKSSGPTPGGQPTKQKKSGTQNHGTQRTHGKGTQTTSTNTETTTTTTQTTTQSTTTPASGASGGFSGPSGPSGASGAGPPSSANSAGRATAGQHAPKAPKAPTHHPSPKTPPPSSGTMVRGELVSEIVPLPADRSPLVHEIAASAGGAPARQAPKGRSVLPIAAAALAILALLGLGAQRELGRPRWWPDLRLRRVRRIGH